MLGGRYRDSLGNAEAVGADDCQDGGRMPGGSRTRGGTTPSSCGAVRRSKRFELGWRKGPARAFPFDRGNVSGSVDWSFVGAKAQ